MKPDRILPLDTIENCRLWLVDLDLPLSPGELGFLSPDEHARARRFAFARDRERFLAGRAALRRLLSQCTGRPSPSLALAYGPFGKPWLPAPRAPAFNMSHSHGLGLVAIRTECVTGESIGVDIEVLRPMSDAAELAGANFEPDESDELRTLPEPARSRAFLLGWTRKEACLKALGSGFSGPSRVATGLNAQARTVAWAAHRAALHSVDLPQFGAVAALARLLPPAQASTSHRRDAALTPGP
ncbi:4'-phosphopantetheinyl transferase family protein [Variovorax soli]|uniref:4'-phosphopantetheinyl transferase family protein n=1 Tax=Variovorax soli TaxID=376815 RepID=UPI00083870A6|nr:4'-phosphopantetheinyl transferase superfamily protein [Variovorax soli]